MIVLLVTVAVCEIGEYNFGKKKKEEINLLFSNHSSMIIFT